jgi:hypothetical protein
MAKFKPPYRPGFYISPREHHGYLYMVAYLADYGRTAEHIRQKCAEAKEAGARKDVLFYDARLRRWVTRAEYSGGLGRRFDRYAAALTKYEEDRAREEGRPA